MGALPYEDDAFDIVLSLNGFHAFPDKEAAYREVFRVLRPGGTFCGCFYVMGEHKRTDWFVRRVYEKTGFFTPPYEMVDSLNADKHSPASSARSTKRWVSGMLMSVGVESSH